MSHPEFLLKWCSQVRDRQTCRGGRGEERGGDACVAHRRDNDARDDGRRKRLHPSQPYPRPYGLAVTFGMAHDRGDHAF